MKVIEDLQLNGLSIVVDKAGFTYGSDAVLLANFANPRRGDSCLDLGAGTGILSILVNGKTGYSRPPASLWRNPSRSTVRAGT